MARVAGMNERGYAGETEKGKKERIKTSEQEESGRSEQRGLRC